MSKDNSVISNKNVVTLSEIPVNQEQAAPESRVRPGPLLLNALFDRAHKLGHNHVSMAMELGVTYGYLSQLHNGIRNIKTIGDDFSQVCADYLQLPRLQVLLMAGRVTPQDNFLDHDTYESDVTRAMNFIAMDNTWAPLISEELRKCSTDTLHGVVKMYEIATGKILMHNRLEFIVLAERAACSPTPGCTP